MAQSLPEYFYPFHPNISHQCSFLIAGFCFYKLKEIKMSLTVDFTLTSDVVTITSCVTSIVIMLFVFLPFVLRSTIHYNAFKDHILLRKRYSDIVIFEAKVYIVKLVWGILWNATFLVTSNDIITAVLFAVNNCIAMLLYSTWIWRFWLLSYNIKYAKYVIQNEWQTIINETYNDRNINWYIRNKKTYGNKNWIKCYFLIPFVIILSILENIWRILEPIYYDKYNNIIYFVDIITPIAGVVPFVILVIIYCKTPSFNDKIFVSKELKYVIISLMFQYMFFFIHILSPNNWYYDDTPTQFESILNAVVVLGVFTSEFAGMMVVTYWVNTKMTPIILGNRYNIIRKDSSTFYTIETTKNQSQKSVTIQEDQYLKLLLTSDHGMESPNNITSIDSMQKSNKSSMGLLVAMQTQDSFIMLMKQLSKEFSIELLVGFIELIQYQQYIIHYMSIHNIKLQQIRGPKPWFKKIKFPDIVPMSHIIYGHNIINQNMNDTTLNDFILQIKTMAHELYLKYIAKNSLYEVNISHRIRRKIDEYFINYNEYINDNNIKLNELLYLFNHCCNELYGLIIDSYQRVKRKTAFKKVEHQMFSN